MIITFWIWSYRIYILKKKKKKRYILLHKQQLNELLLHNLRNLNVSCQNLSLCVIFAYVLFYIKHILYELGVAHLIFFFIFGGDCSLNLGPSNIKDKPFHTILVGLFLINQKRKEKKTNLVFKFFFWAKLVF